METWSRIRLLNHFSTGKIKKLYFWDSMIPQILNISNWRTTNAKFINLHIIRKLIEHSLKQVTVKTMLTLTVFKILLNEGMSVLEQAHRVPEGERAKNRSSYNDNSFAMKRTRPTLYIYEVVFKFSFCGAAVLYRGWLLHLFWYLNLRYPAAHLKLLDEDLDIRPRIWVWICRLVLKSLTEDFGIRYATEGFIKSGP